MRILHIISQRPDSTGSGIYLQEILRNARRNGHTNFLIAGICSTSTEPHLTGGDIEGVDYVRFKTDLLPFSIAGMSDIMPYESSLFKNFDQSTIDQYTKAFSAIIIKRIETFKPDIIHTHHLWLLSSLLKQIAPQIPVVTHCHGSDLRQVRQCENLREKVIAGCSQLDHVYALSNAQKQDIIDLYGISQEKISVVGAGFNQDVFRKHIQEHVNTSECTFSYAGKLSYAKGVPYLLQAFQKLPHSNWRLDIIGSGTGEEFETCLSLIAQMKDRMTHHGAVGQQELAGYMQNSDVFVLPSLFEGMPLVVLEALACGCHVLSTALPGVLEIKEKSTTAQITTLPLPKVHSVDKLDDLEADLFVNNLAHALKTIIDNHCSPLVPLSASDVDIDHFLWENVFNRIEQKYQQTKMIFDK